MVPSLLIVLNGIHNPTGHAAPCLVVVQEFAKLHAFLTSVQVRACATSSRHLCRPCHCQWLHRPASTDCLNACLRPVAPADQLLLL
jgi:hypothetical protein